MRKSNVLTLTILAIFLNSCRASLPVRTFTAQENAGTVQIAVQSIAPFDEDFINQLQPALVLSDEQAAAAIALSRIQDVQRFRAMLLEAGIALPTDTTAITKTLAADGTKSVTGTEERKPGDISTVPAAPAEKTATIVPFAPSEAKIATDASLAYRANLALRQEVALLNRQVRDAAISRGTRPYVLRFLVTLSPSARREPYDTFASVSLFATKGEKEFSTEIARLFVPEQRDVEAVINALRDDVGKKQLRELVEHVRETDEQTYKVMGELLTKSDDYCQRAVEMVPLFVTDNLESSSDTTALQSVLSVGTGASGTVQNIGGRIAARFQDDRQQRARTTGFNALYTVGRVTTNTIEARLGAFSSGVDVEMVPRTYNVTVLALVPTLGGVLDEYEAGIKPEERSLMRSFANEVLACRELAFSSLYRFTDARSGRTLRTAFERVAEIELRGVGRRWGFSPFDSATLLKLMTYAQTNDFKAFDAALDDRNVFVAGVSSEVSDEAERQMLWIDLVNVAKRSGRGYGRISVPQPSFKMFPALTSATIVDDGEKAAVTLAGANDLTSTGLEAVLEFGSDLQHTFYATKSTVNKEGRRATFEFESPFAYLGKKMPEKARLTVIRASGSRGFQSSLERQYVAETSGNGVTLARLTLMEKPKAEDKKKDPVPVLMNVTSDHIVLAENRQTGTISISFAPLDAKKPQKVRISVKGADLVSTAPESAVDGLDRLAPANGAYTLLLRNIAENDLVTIIAHVDKENARGDEVGRQSVRVIDYRREPARLARGIE